MAMVTGTALVLAGCTGGSPVASNDVPSSPPPTQTPATLTAPPATPSTVPLAAPWSATGSMITGRAEHTATLLPDGTVLVAGGVADNREETVLASAELYDPNTGTWTATGSMTNPRSQHTATLLPNGKVLVTGGYCDGTTPQCVSSIPAGAWDPDGAMATAEVYDPSTHEWTATGRMITARSNHTATLLDNGMVLVVGAEHAPDSILASSELYDLSTGKWTATRDMITARTQQMATLLPGGRVLVAGGFGPVSPTAHGDLRSAELYDPRSGKWKVTGSMAAARESDPLIVLANGLVLKTGGGPDDPAACELYDPRTGTWSPTGSMAVARGQLSSSLLVDGRVLVAAGFGVDLASAELYDPAAGTWSDAGSFGVGRFEHTATLLPNGKVLVTGGLLSDGVASSAELFDPAAGT
jgi:large repetitive protein